MDRQPIVFLDSGIGGIPYCTNFLLRNPDETIIYLADRLNFPYGVKARHEIERILLNLVEHIIEKAAPKLLVIACNTAAISALDILRKTFSSLPFVGTVPAVKSAVNASKTKNIAVLGTGRTVDDAYIAELACRCDPDVTIHGIAADELVEFVEKQLDIAAPEEKIDIVRGYLERARSLSADALVLGCTHFLYLAAEFRSAAAPDIQVFDSLDGITRRIESLLDEADGKLRAGPGSSTENLLVLTGAEVPDSAWKSRAEKLGFRLSLMEDL